MTDQDRIDHIGLAEKALEWAATPQHGGVSKPGTDSEAAIAAALTGLGYAVLALVDRVQWWLDLGYQQALTEEAECKHPPESVVVNHGIDRATNRVERWRQCTVCGHRLPQVVP